MSRFRRQTRPGIVLILVAGLSLQLAGCTNKKLQQKYSGVADRIHARDGHIVSEHFSGGGADGPFTLGIVTLRPGNPNTVAAAQAQAAEAIGYSDSLGSCEQFAHCIFDPVSSEDLPSLDISTYPGGTTLPGTTVLIPVGDTALAVDLSNG